MVIDDPIADGDLPGLCERVRALLRASAVEVVVCDVRALAADAITVDALARLQLTARRLGRQIRLHGASAELDRLLDFVGLTDAIAMAGRLGLGLEAIRQAEEPEQPRRVEERVDRGDAAT